MGIKRILYYRQYLKNDFYAIRNRKRNTFQCFQNYGSDISLQYSNYSLRFYYKNVLYYLIICTNYHKGAHYGYLHTQVES